MSAAKSVSFTQRKDSTKEDDLLLEALEKPYLSLTPDRIAVLLRRSCASHHSAINRFGTQHAHAKTGDAAT